MLIKAGVMSKLLKKVDRASLIDDHGRLNEAIADRYCQVSSSSFLDPPNISFQSLSAYAAKIH
jgi:hypothetical protein